MTWRTERDTEFHDFVLAERPGLVRAATALAGGDRHRAEDAVRAALTRVYLAWHRLRPDGRAAYARRSVVNAVMDEHRRSRRRRETLTDEPPDAAVAESGAGGDQPVVRLLARLPPGMRAAVVLRHVEGMSVAEAASVLQCSEGTVRSQCARGLDHLRAALTTAS